ncbi:transposon Ty3-I Gag-Pol polyprotein [Nephila pilipes]|uniref:Transposon Ty3-I Gag-Pol polyprotein n=1 Tax=Nephila pilipes TaxID=299642 RepID=A0A8X6R655_NEPPI|nr:transposon Ty3-I Gag-Pol polyprotein [Nephila pilipes]
MDNKPKTMDKGAIIASYEPVVDIVARPQEFSGGQPIQSILENLEGLNEDQNFSTIATSLHEVTEAKSSFNWTEECQKSFNSLKQTLTTSTVLTYPRTDEDFILDTDASNEGVGAVLFQKIENEDNTDHMVAKRSSQSILTPRGNAGIRPPVLATNGDLETNLATDDKNWHQLKSSFVENFPE